MAGELSLVDGADDDLEIWGTNGTKLDSGEGVTLIRGGGQKSLHVDDADEANAESELLLVDNGTELQEEKSNREKSFEISKFDSNAESAKC